MSFLPRCMEESQTTLATSTLSYISIYIYIYIYIRQNFCERILTQNGRDNIVGIATRYGLEGSGSNSGERNIFSLLHALPDRPWGLLSLLYNGYRISFWRIKWPGRGVDHLPLKSIEVMTELSLYLFTHSVPAWHGTRRPLSLTLS
jgi:hypothetical protein